MDVRQAARHLRDGLAPAGTVVVVEAPVPALSEHKADEDPARAAVELCEWQLRDLRERVGRARDQREAGSLHAQIGRVQERLEAAQRALSGGGRGEGVEEAARRLVLDFAARLRRRFEGEQGVLDRIDAAAREVAGDPEGGDDGSPDPFGG